MSLINKYALGVSASILLIALISGCATPAPENITEDTTVQDTRTHFNRSIEFPPLVFETAAFSYFLTSYRGQEPKGGGYFFVVDYTITNGAPEGDKKVPFSRDFISLYISTNESLTPNPTLSSFVPTTVSPGATYESAVVFEVPASADPYLVVLKPQGAENANSISVPSVKTGTDLHQQEDLAGLETP